MYNQYSKYMIPFMFIKPKVPNRVKELMNLRGYTARKVATDANYSEDTINRLKAGRKSPQMSVEHMLRLANILKVYPSELLPLEWQKPA